jgi:hypothetical protein
MSDLKRTVLASIFVAALVWPMLASADFVESPPLVELSGDHLNPTPVPLVPNGATTVSGSVEGKGKGVSVDLDYFTVTVPAGQILTSVNVLPDTVGGGAIGGFIAIFSGATAVDPDLAVSTDLLGYYLYSDDDIGTSILDDMGTFDVDGNSPSIGFTPPLLSGTYTFWIQEGALGVFPYGFELVLSAPAPPAILLLALAGLATGLGRYGRAIGRACSRTGANDTRS